MLLIQLLVVKHLKQQVKQNSELNPDSVTEEFSVTATDGKNLPMTMEDWAVKLFPQTEKREVGVYFKIQS